MTAKAGRGLASQVVKDGFALIWRRACTEISCPSTNIRSTPFTIRSVRDFPGGPVVGRPAASAGDTGSVPAPGRFHTPRASKPVRHNYQARSLKPVLHNKRSHWNEKPVHCKKEQIPLAAARESPQTVVKTQHSQK